MFTNLKKAFTKVSKNVNLSKNQETANAKPTGNDIGAAILSRFQESWAEIHELNEENAIEAQNCAKKISDIHRKLVKSKESIEQITNIIAEPCVRNGIDKCACQILMLCKSCEEIEKELLHFEDLIEQVNLEQMKAEHVAQLQVYKVKRVADLEKQKLSLAEKYTGKVKELEHRQVKRLQERQQVFQEAFSADLEMYKQHKTIPKIDKLSNSSVLLEEIQIDYNQQELDKFLEE